MPVLGTHCSPYKVSPRHIGNSLLYCWLVERARVRPQTTNETYPSWRITLSAPRMAATGSTKTIADNPHTAVSNVRSANGRSSAEHCLKWMFVRPACLLLPE